MVGTTVAIVPPGAAQAQATFVQATAATSTAIMTDPAEPPPPPPRTEAEDVKENGEPAEEEEEEDAPMPTAPPAPSAAAVAAPPATVAAVAVAAPAQTGGGKRSPSDFLKTVLGRPVVVKLNSGIDYRGERFWVSVPQARRARERSFLVSSRRRRSSETGSVMQTGGGGSFAVGLALGALVHGYFPGSFAVLCLPRGPSGTVFASKVLHCWNKHTTKHTTMPPLWFPCRRHPRVHRHSSPFRCKDFFASKGAGESTYHTQQLVQYTINIEVQPAVRKPCKFLLCTNLSVHCPTDPRPGVSTTHFVCKKGVLACLDGYMNIAMEQTEEYVNGQLKAKYGDCFIRGNNGEQLKTGEEGEQKKSTSSS